MEASHKDYYTSPCNFVSTQTSLTNVLMAETAKKKDGNICQMSSWASCLFLHRQIINWLWHVRKTCKQLRFMKETKQNRKCLHEQLGQSQATNISRYWNPLFRGDTQFKCFSYVSELFTALSRWFSCDFMCLPRKSFHAAAGQREGE